MLMIFDVQMYLEDDIKFDDVSFSYWLKYFPFCESHGYNLGFVRVERDQKNEFYCTDITIKPAKVVDLGGRKFLLNNVNPYCAFWIYRKDTLKKFIQSKEWRFQFQGFPLREKSAIGWHGLNMAGFKGTLIPLVESSTGNYQVIKECQVHHLPNSYIGHDVFCRIPFPITVESPRHLAIL